MSELKKYRGVMFEGTEYWCKIWRKIDLCFQKWREKFSKFSPEQVWNSKIWTFIGSFYPKKNELKIYRGVVSCQWKMMQNLKRNWLVSSKLTWGIWRILTRALKNIKICTLMGCWPKYIMFELKKYRAVMFEGTEDWCKIWRKTDFCFLKWH